MSTGGDQEPRQVKPSPMRKSNLINAATKAHLTRGLANDAMSKALDRISQSPFTRRIEGAELPRRFHQPAFAIYNGWTDPVKHVSQFNQRMGPMGIRWFDGFKPNSINSFKQLTQAFGSHFITSSRVPQPLDSLLSLSMREGETLKAYSDRY